MNISIDKNWVKRILYETLEEFEIPKGHVTIIGKEKENFVNCFLDKFFDKQEDI